LSLDIASPGLRPVQCASSVLTVSYILSKRQRFGFESGTKYASGHAERDIDTHHQTQQNLECLSQLPLEETTKTRDLQDEARRFGKMPSILCKQRSTSEGAMHANWVTYGTMA